MGPYGCLSGNVIIFYLICLQGLWDVVADSSNSCTLRVYVNVAFSKKTMWKGVHAYIRNQILYWFTEQNKTDQIKTIS